jgi:hypothetical protein
MRAVLLVCFAVLAAQTAAFAQGIESRGRDQLWSPPWAAELPWWVPNGSIAVTAEVVDANQRDCAIFMDIYNGTAEQIRSAFVTIDIVFPRRSVLATTDVRWVDPSSVRDIQFSVPGGCMEPPVRVILRQMSACVRGERHRSGCGAPVVALSPRGERPFDALPVQIDAGAAR